MIRRIVPPQPYSLLFCVISIAAASAGPILRVGAVKSEVKLDGDLADWQAAARISPLRTRDNALPLARTTVYLAYDERALYAAFECESAGGVPTGEGEEKVSVVLGSQGRCTVFSVGLDGSKVGDFEAAIKPTDSGYVAEMRIPVEAFGRTKLEAGSQIPFNVTRTSSATGESLCWGEPSDSLSQDAAVAILDTTAPSLQLEIPSPGKLSLYGQENASSYAVFKAVVEIDQGARRIERYLRLEPGASGKIDIQFEPPEKPYSLAFSVETARSDVVYLKTPEFVFWPRKPAPAKPVGTLSEVRAYKPLEGSLPLGSLKEILISRDATTQEKAAAAMIAGELREACGLAVPVEIGRLSAPEGGIIVGVHERFFVARSFFDGFGGAPDAALGRQAYNLLIRDSKAGITARSGEGVLNGAATLCQMLRLAEGGCKALPYCRITDGPQIEYRGSISLTRRGAPEEFYRRLALYKINLCRWTQGDEEVARSYGIYLVKDTPREIAVAGIRFGDGKDQLPVVRLDSASEGYRKLLGLAAGRARRLGEEPMFALEAVLPSGRLPGFSRLERVARCTASYAADTARCRVAWAHTADTTPISPKEPPTIAPEVVELHDFFGALFLAANAWTSHSTHREDFPKRLGAILFGSEETGPALADLDRLAAAVGFRDAKAALETRLEPPAEAESAARKLEDTFLAARREQSLALGLAGLSRALLVSAVNLKNASLYRRAETKGAILDAWLKELESLKLKEAEQSIRYLSELKPR